jgi:hypothetical protein
MEDLIHAVNVTPEAAFDYAACFGEARLDKKTLKAELSEYIGYMTAAGRIPWWGYFRCDYDDARSGRRLKLFLYRQRRLGNMQYWDLVGLCLAEDWSEDAEDDGAVRRWLKEKVEDVPDYDDWVVRRRVNEILNETSKTLWENVLEEVKNAFDCERDKEAAEKLAFLQSVHFEFSRRRRVKKTRRIRREHN